MQSRAPIAAPPWLDTLSQAGYVFVPGDQARVLLAEHGSLADWPLFAASWNELEPDTYLAQLGRHRRRRHAVYRVSDKDGILRQPHQPHYQSTTYNTLQGGIQRWFAPVSGASGDSASLHSILHFARHTFTQRAPAIADWRVEVHQFRIEAQAGAPGLPTPEGSHRDGVDYVLVLMIERRNIACGTTTIHTPAGKALGEFTLAAPFDLALVDDARVHHGVTPVEAIDPAQHAYRDVLVVTFRSA